MEINKTKQMDIGEIVRCRYRIVDVLKTSRWNNTYLAEDIDLPYRNFCVIREIKTELDLKSQYKNYFNKISQTLYQLGITNDSFPSLLASFEENGFFYIIEEFIDGKNLESLIIPGKKWGEFEIVKLLEDILKALLDLHDKNIPHKSIKPSNLVYKNEGELRLLVGNMFKNSIHLKVKAPDLALNGQQLSDFRLSDDIYSVGLLAISALTGIPTRDLPKNPTNGEIIWEEWAQVTPKTKGILNKMISCSFSERYQSAFDALEAIKKRKMQFLNKPFKTSNKVLKISIGVMVAITMFILGGQLITANSTTNNLDLNDYYNVFKNKK